MFSFHLLVYHTLSNKFSYLSFHSGPSVLSPEIMIHLCATWMHHKLRLMGQLMNIKFPTEIPKSFILVLHMDSLCGIHPHNCFQEIDHLLINGLRWWWCVSARFLPSSSPSRRHLSSL
ncbi:hypothetical protein ACOSP7_011419 [Xanthoceras sorbifolium]